MNWRNSISRCDASWVTDAGSESYTHLPNTDFEIFEIPSDIGECNAKLYTLPLGSTISTFDYIFEKNTEKEIVHFLEIEKNYDEPTLVIFSVLSGQMIFKDKIFKKSFAVNPNEDFFQFSKQQEYSLDIDTTQNISAVKLILSESFLNGLLGKEIVKSLLNKLNLCKTPSYASKKIPPDISFMLQECILGADEGVAKSLEIQGKVLIFLSALTNHLLDIDNNNNRNRNTNIARKLHDDILSMEGRIPALSFFSEKYGLSTKALNENFKSVYGKTIWSYILEHRLLQAHTILSESDTAIKSIADNLGYSNVSHFTNAFKRKYGYTPGELRKY